jgi:hypothetical protein
VWFFADADNFLNGELPNFSHKKNAHVRVLAWIISRRKMP